MTVATVSLAEEIERSRRTLLAVAKSLPKRDELGRELEDAEAAQARGYYLPDEDERLREVFVRYLHVRSSLLDIVAVIEPWVWHGKALDEKQRHSVFLIGFTAACYLIRSGRFLIRMAESGRVVRRKLDEAEPRYAIPRKSFTRAS